MAQKKKEQIKYALSSSDSSSKSISQFLWHVVPINCWLFLSSILTGFPEHSGGSTKGVQCLTHQQYTMNRQITDPRPRPRPLNSRVQLSTQTIRPLWPSLTVLFVQFIPSWCDLCRHQTSSFPVFPRPIMVFDLDINMIKDVVHPAFIELGLKQKT